MKREALLLYFAVACSLWSRTGAKPLIGQDVKELKGEDRRLPVVALAHMRDNCPVEEKVFCTGSLITRSHVLTAEHCFDEEEAFYVIAESNDLRLGRTLYPAWYMSYNQWCRTRRRRPRESNNDIALVKIYGQVAERFVPLQRSTVSRHSNHFGSLGTIAGWGKLIDGTLPTNLHVGNVTVIPTSECVAVATRILGERIPVPPNYICSRTVPYVIATAGDSGSPLIIDGILVGVTKGAFPLVENQFHPDKANIHITVKPYDHFIDNLIAD